MVKFPILYWSYNSDRDSDYKLIKSFINSRHELPPRVLGDDFELKEILEDNTDSVLYYPIFKDTIGWWGELLGQDLFVTERILVSNTCQLMMIEYGKRENSKNRDNLLAAEINPNSGFFNKINSSIATISDMLATDAGTVLALFSGKDKDRFINVVKSTGNSYLGCIGYF